MIVEFSNQTLCRFRLLTFKNNQAKKIKVVNYKTLLINLIVITTITFFIIMLNVLANIL